MNDDRTAITGHGSFLFADEPRHLPRQSKPQSDCLDLFPSEDDIPNAAPAPPTGLDWRRLNTPELRTAWEPEPASPLASRTRLGVIVALVAAAGILGFGLVSLLLR